MTALFGFGVAIVVLGAFRTFADSMDAQLAFAAVLYAFVAAVVTLATERYMRRDWGSTEQALAYSRALRTGKLPAHIEPDAWRAWLNRSRNQNRVAWVVPCVLTLVWLASFPFHLSGWWYHWVIDLLFATLVGWLSSRWWLRRGWIPRLTIEVEKAAVRLHPPSTEI